MALLLAQTKLTVPICKYLKGEMERTDIKASIAYLSLEPLPKTGERNH